MREGLRIAMWSGPRNISTALMRAWENREDAAVIDEPFYAHYLVETGIEHPGREDVIAAHETDAAKVARMLVGPIPGGKAIWYQKHMAQHMLPEMLLDWLDGLTNCFLIRRPEEVAASFTIKRPDAEAWELGFESQARIFEHVRRTLGHPPPVIDAADVLQDPRGTLGALCAKLGIPFSERMLAWPAGRRASDGAWAPHWYAAVERSTGFGPYRPYAGKLTDAQQRLADACRPYYERLARHRLRAR